LKASMYVRMVGIFAAGPSGMTSHLSCGLPVPSSRGLSSLSSSVVAELGMLLSSFFEGALYTSYE